MERELEAPVRVRLRFSNKHLLSKEQRSKGFRRCWAVVRPEIVTVGEFSEHIKGFFGLRCASADDLFLSMGGFILPPSESACVFKDKELIRVQTSMSKKKKKIAIIENQTVLSIDNGENLNENLNHQKKRKQKDTDNPESSKKKIKNKSHETPIIINTSNNNKSSMTIIDDPSNQKNKQIMVNDDGANENDEIGPVIGNSVLGLPPSNLMPAGAGPSNWQTDQTKQYGSNAKKSNWKPKNNYNNQEGPNRKNTWKPWSESNNNQNSTNSQLRICNNNNDNNNNNNNNNNNEANKGKNIIEEEDEKSNEDELNFESLYPMVRLPKEGDIIAYRLMDSSSGFFDLSQFRVGEVLIFDPIIMEIVLGSVPEYPIFPNGERPNNSLYKEDGTLGVDFGSLVDLRLVKESQIEIAPKGNYSKSGKVKSKNKNKGNNWNNAEDNVGNLEAGTENDLGGNNNANSAWEIGEGSNTKEIEENGWGTWAPSNNKKTNTFGNNNNNNNSNGFGRNNNNNYNNNNGYGSRGGFHKRNNGRGGGNNQRNSGWEATEPASNVNETAQQTQENGWDSWPPSTSRAVASRPNGGQNGNFGSRGGFSRGRGRNGRGGKYYNPKFTK